MSLPEENAESSSVAANVPIFLSHEEQNMCTTPESPQVLDLSSVARIKNHQIPVGMETEVTDTNSDLNREKSSYEIAAEALCLMKSGGLVPLDGKRDINTEENVNAQSHFCNSDVKFTLASHFDTEIHLEPKMAKEFHKNVKTVENTSRSDNVLSALNFVNSDPQVEIIGSHVIMSVSSESSSSSALQNSSFTATPLHMSPTISASSSQPIKYVIVPESTLLSMVKQRDSVSVDSVPGTQYYFLMPTEKQPATKVISTPRLQSLNQDNAPPDCKPSVFDVGKNIDMSSVSVNISKNATFSDKSLQSNKNYQSSALNVKNTAGRRSVMKKHDTLKFPPCIICDGEASGFHYGCNTCEACKNFFRRCLLRKSDMPFICHSNKTCEISFKKNKNNCSACRLDKCLEMGMAKEKCKMGRYTALMRTETIKKVRKLEGKDEDNAETSSVDSPGPNAIHHDETFQSSDTSSLLEHVENKDICAEIISKQIFTAENELPANANKTEYNERLIQYLVSAMDNIKPWGENLVTEEARKTLTKEHYEKYKARKAKVQAVGSLIDLSGHENQEILKKFKMDEDGQLDLLKKWRFDWETVIGRYCSFAKCIPEFRSLCYSDQTSLLKATHFDFFTIILHQGYFPEYGVFLEINGEPYHIEEAANQFFTRDFVFLMVDMMSRLQKLNLSKSEMALLISIITLSSDQCELVNSKLVEDTQLRLVELLLKELCKAHGQSGGSKRLTSFIDAITRMREVSSVYFKEYRTLCNNDYKKETVPNLDVTLSEEHR